MQWIRVRRTREHKELMRRLGSEREIRHAAAAYSTYLTPESIKKINWGEAMVLLKRKFGKDGATKVVEEAWRMERDRSGL